MDLTQKKLTKSEWESIETPVSDKEKKILKVILDGYENVQIRYNDHQSLIQFTHLQESEDTDAYFFHEFFLPGIETILLQEQTKKTEQKKHNKPGLQEGDKEIAKALQTWLSTNVPKQSLKKIKKIDLMRIQHVTTTINTQKQFIFEFLLCDFCKTIWTSLYMGTTEYAFPSIP